MELDGTIDGNLAAYKAWLAKQQTLEEQEPANEQEPVKLLIRQYKPYDWAEDPDIAGEN